MIIQIWQTKNGISHKHTRGFALFCFVLVIYYVINRMHLRGLFIQILYAAPINSMD